MNDADKDFYDSMWDSNASKIENDEPDSKDELEDDLKKEEVIISNKMHSCNNCKTSFINNNELNECPYCHKEDCTNIDLPIDKDLFYLPFNNSLEDAIKCYKKSMKFSLFIPLFFRKKLIYSKMKKVYIPLELYNSKVSGEVSFYGADENSINRQKEIKKYECSYDVNVDYDNVYVSRYSRINENGYNNIFNYNYALISPYQEGIIKDEYIIGADLNNDEIQNKLNNKLIKYSLNMVRGSINHQLKKVKDNNLTLQTKDKFNVLVPIYLLNLEYKNKKCLFMMNGQNGEFYFNSDVSLFNIIIFALILFFVIFLLAYFFAYFL